MLEISKKAISGLTIILLASCGGGGDSSGGSTSTNPLAKYEGTYYACDGRSKETLAITAAGENSANFSIVEEIYANDNCSGPIIGTYRRPLPATAHFDWQINNQEMPNITILPASGNVDRVTLNSPAMKASLTGTGVTGNCVYFNNGNECYDSLDLPLTSVTGGFYQNGNYLVIFLSEDGTLTADSIYSKDASFNYNQLVESETNQPRTPALIEEAKTYVSDQMLDPSSVLFRNVSVYRPLNDGTVCGEFNAKNRFGAYTGYKPFYYRPNSSLDTFVYYNDSSQYSSATVERATLSLIRQVCSNITQTEANAAEANWISELL